MCVQGAAGAPISRRSTCRFLANLIIGASVSFDACEQFSGSCGDLFGSLWQWHSMRFVTGMEIVLALAPNVVTRGGPISRDKLIGHDNERPTQMHTVHGGLCNSSNWGNCLRAIKNWKKVTGNRSVLHKLHQRFDVPVNQSLSLQGQDVQPPRPVCHEWGSNCCSWWARCSPGPDSARHRAVGQVGCAALWQSGD